MAVNGIVRSRNVPDCEICKAEPARVRSIITDPLIMSVSTYVGDDCYQLNARAAASLLAESPRLVLVEVLA